MNRSGLPFSVRKRSNVNLTSSAVSSRPFTGGLLCQRTPRRRKKTTVVSSGSSQRSARSGSTMKVPGITDGPTLWRTSLLWTKLSVLFVLKFNVRCGSKMGRIVAAHAENSSALALRPERARRQQRLGRQRGSDREARSEEIATGQPRAE